MTHSIQYEVIHALFISTTPFVYRWWGPRFLANSNSQQTMMVEPLDWVIVETFKTYFHSLARSCYTILRGMDYLEQAEPQPSRSCIHLREAVSNLLLQTSKNLVLELREE